MKKKKGEVQFNTPVEELQNRQLTPEQEEQRARMASLKKPRQPLGGAPPVQVPPLNAEPIPGQTMEEQAEVLRDATSPVSPAYDPNLAMMTKGQPPVGHQAGVGPAPFASVPEQMQNDPRFRQGVGSMVAGNQPHLRNPDGSWKPNISPETQRQMNDLAEFQDKAQRVQAQEAASKEKEATKKDSEAELYDELRQMLGSDEKWNKLNNPERRKKIEDKLAPMNFTDIIIHGELRQDVSVRNNLMLTFRTVSSEEDLAVKRLMFGEEGGDRYLMDKFSIMQLTLALVAINNEELPTHLDKDKKFSEAHFDKKFEKVLRFPITLVADFGLQYMWFHDRVQDLLLDEEEELKNG